MLYQAVFKKFFILLAKVQYKAADNGFTSHLNALLICEQIKNMNITIIHTQ